MVSHRISQLNPHKPFWQVLKGTNLNKPRSPTKGNSAGITQDFSIYQAGPRVFAMIISHVRNVIISHVRNVIISPCPHLTTVHHRIMTNGW